MLKNLINFRNHSIHMNQILEIGSVLHTNKDGFLIPQANKSKIKGKWKEAVDFLVNEYLENLGEKNIHSVWIRGSVAKGEAIDNISDIDSFCLVNTTDIDISFLQKSEHKIKQKFPFVTKIETEFIPIQKLFEDEDYFWWRFALKTQSVCVYGEDIASQIPSFKPDKKLAKKIQEHLEKRIMQAKEKIEKNSGNETQIKTVCSWIMKRIVRQGFILVMVEECVFTRDLYPCYKTFSKHYPEKEEEMKTALELAIYPVSDIKRIFLVLDNLGKWLIYESKGKIDASLVG